MINSCLKCFNIKKHDKVIDKECSICFEKITNPIFLKCNHVYCENCITKWFNIRLKKYESLSCPTCRIIYKKNELITLISQLQN